MKTLTLILKNIIFHLLFLFLMKTDSILIEPKINIKKIMTWNFDKTNSFLNNKP